MSTDPNAPLWQPTAQQISATQLSEFCNVLNARHGKTLRGYRDLHRLSIEEDEMFWTEFWDYAGIKCATRGERVLINGNKMPGAQFFPDARLNFAENLLARDDDSDALVFWGEDKERRRMSWRELRALVSSLQQALVAAGVGLGDRVAAMMPNMPEAIAAMLATSSLGAVFSSCSPDFGERGVLDRFGQIEPKVLFACDGYWYGGKRIEVAEKVTEIAKGLPTLHQIVIVPYAGLGNGLAEKLPKAIALPELIAKFPAKTVTFTQVPFAHPLFILFSSGTTGIPKCIVHATGGILLQLVKEHRLHCDIRPGERVFYFTTCGWMMWNWLVAALASQATLLLYDGSPLLTNEILFDLAVKERMNVFGTSAKYIDGVRKTGWEPKTTHDLSSVRLLTSTGSPLAPESFDFVYQSIKSDVHLASMSGGTDICSCFVAGDPTGAVWKGEIQAATLGMAVEVWDDDGKPVGAGQKGELVCVKPFPSMPVMFWADPQGAKYHSAYFERFDNIWCHGDFAEWTEHGGIIIHGRSDATLNPGGVRIGTAEIYAQVERIPDIIEALAIGQDWDNDVRVVLFVRLAAGVSLDVGLVNRIKQQVRTGASPRHVPAKIIAVDDIPRTKSGKITELAVRDVVHGRSVKNQEALANPEALALFQNLADLQH